MNISKTHYSLALALFSMVSLIRIKVTALSTLRGAIGKDTPLTLEQGGTIGDLITKLDEDYGQTYSRKTGENLRDSVLKRFNLMIDGKIILPHENLSRPLNDGDEVLLVQFVGGG